LEEIRRRVRGGIAAIEAGKFTEYEGREGLRKFADKVKKNGRSRFNAQARRIKSK
jgi:hypothetical protein